MSTKLVPARSLNAADVGQVLFINRAGDIVGPKRMRRRAAFAGALVGGVLVAAGLVYGSMFGPLAGSAATLGVAGFFLWQLRHARAIRAAVAFIADGKRDEAYAAFLALEARSLPPRQRDFVAARLAALAWQRGAREEAALRYDKVLPRLARG